MLESAIYFRSSHNYVDLSSRFQLKQKECKGQYAHIYTARLWSLAPFVENAARKTWDDNIVLRKLSELQTGEQCVIIGTIFKKMKLKPNILLDIGKNYNIVPKPPKRNYIDSSDQVILEDETQRVVLLGNTNAKRMVTGSVVAVFGNLDQNDAGNFIVHGITYRAVPAQIPRPTLEMDRYIVIVSGLDIGSQAVNMLHLQLLVDLLAGQLGDEDTQSWMSNIVRVVIAGNSLFEPIIKTGCVDKVKYLSKKPASSNKDAISTFDEILVQLAAGVDVDIMPGLSDPTTFILPQQALHPCLFPKAAKYETMHCVTNPYNFSIDGIEVLGTSGQPIQDICKFSDIEDDLEALQLTLEVGHLAPTAPDTLGCYPYPDIDPFMIDRWPHIYFSGNAPILSKKILRAGENTTLLINIPKFSHTLTCAAINLRNVDVVPIKVAAVDGCCEGSRA